MATSPEIRTAIRLLEVFREVDPEITLPSMLAFLYSVEEDNRPGNQMAVSERLGMAGSTGSRAVSYWHDYKKPRVPGMDYIERVINPDDRRYKTIVLNQRGMKFAEKIEEAISGSPKR
ncbi:MAG: MarR family winged helix-turn-helix transcriptional regulator [Pseudomonadota bacterium]